MERSLFSFNHTMMSGDNNNLDFYKTNLTLNLPLKLKRGFLINSVNFNYYQINYSNTSIITSDINELYSIKYTLTYIRPLSKKWSISTQAGVSLASNLKSSITSNDFVYNASLLAIKKGGNTKQPSRLMFGLAYSTFSGEYRFLPIINYTKVINNKFSYGIGFPRTYFKYNINSRNILKIQAELNGLNANLSNPLGVNTNNLAQKASFTTAGLGLEYTYWMDNNWAISFNGGYAIYNNYELQDENYNKVHEFKVEPAPSFSAGLKFNLKNKTIK